MKVRVINDLSDLAGDTRRVATEARRDMVGVVRDGIRAGATVSRDNAKRSAGKHGKHYHRAITAEMHGVVGFGGAAGISGEWGPERGKRQGNMSFERGSRNQKPHLDLARAADLVVPAFHREVHRLPEKWFW